MPEMVEVVINGQARRVAAGTTVAAAVVMAGVPTRRSVSGEERSVLCGMGICMECRMVVDGRAQERSCQVVCRAGMEIRTDD